MKYRIVKLHNGNFQIQYKHSLFSKWELIGFSQYSTFLEAEKSVKLRIEEYEISKGEKIKCVHEVYDI